MTARRPRLGVLFAGQPTFIQQINGSPIGPTVLANGSNISPQALALMQAKLPNGQFLIPTPQKVVIPPSRLPSKAHQASPTRAFTTKTSSSPTPTSCTMTKTLFQRSFSLPITIKPPHCRPRSWAVLHRPQLSNGF